MQTEVATISAELGKANRELEESRRAPVHAWRNHVPNGLAATSPLNASIVRNTSRASTPTPVPPKMSTPTPPENDTGLPATSTWNSMHAPKAARPQSHITPSSRYKSPRASILGRRPTGSPTASVVSVAPTLQEDGWWA